ncbi:3',5'-cyclic-AMP phosphodiesterase [Marinobacter nauticus]
MTQIEHNPPLRVLQLTDPHLMASEEGSLLGVNTRDSLDAVIAEALKVHGKPDLILATGDLTQDASPEAYRYFGERLKAFNAPSVWIAGNHDDGETLGAVADEFDANRRQLVLGGWHFVMLDSSVPGKVFGELADAELAFLDQALSEYPELPTMICLHHHPVSIGSAWMDKIGLTNPEPFWRVVDRHRQVKVVLWGHIHQDFQRNRNGVELLATPSTCIQFTSGSDDFAVEPLAPGYRWFELHPSGDCCTLVHRAEQFEFTLDQSAGGY